MMRSGRSAQRRAHQVGHRDHARRVGADGASAQRDDVRRGALQLARVLDQDHPLVEIAHLGEQRVGERRLARRGAADDEDVPVARRPPWRGSRAMSADMMPSFT